MTNVLYRYANTGDVVLLETHRIAKRTPKGVWIQEHAYAKKRFVLNDGVKRFAYETKELAKESFLARKRRQISILTAQLDGAKLAITNMQEDKIGYEHRSSRFTFDMFEDN